MAGNIPLVGFHDLLCVLAAGHTAVVKMSDKDSILLPYFVSQWNEILPGLKDQVHIVDKLSGMDAVIATGSNNSLRYFEYYFQKYPHLFRHNRNGVAVLNGDETVDELKWLARDIFLYFGLGCRNVAKVYVPEKYDFGQWPEAIGDWSFLADHNKYRNNLDYNYAIYITNHVPHIHLGHLILKEDDQIASRIGCLHFQYYQRQDQLNEWFHQQKADIQCVVSQQALPSWDHIKFGESQEPGLEQYADGVDTMQFLTQLSR
jgi:hypothetical protein